MKYVSTRGAAPVLDFADVLLAGLANDGGLYVPETWPALPPITPGASYADAAMAVMWPYVEGSLDRATFEAIVRDTYTSFRHDAVCPLVQLDSNEWMLELFHGPTLAFKDVALQLLGRLFDEVLTARNERLTIVGATSGDTGSAAIDAMANRHNVDIVILYPYGRVSDVQRRQMTTVDAPNVHAVAVEGTFDDCQDLVKAMFADVAFRERMHLSAVNSINWARVMAQIVYYVTSAVSLGAAPGREIAFTVPTGNFGNVLSGWIAKRMGLPVHSFVIGSNRNDILTRFLDSGVMAATGVEPSLSPSMDIQVSSNFERLLFEVNGRDGGLTAEQMHVFRSSGRLPVEAAEHEAITTMFRGARVDDDATLAVIRDVHRRSGQLIDPHTAVGVGAAHARRGDRDVPMIVLSTAHPAKFPDAVERATGMRPPLPEFLGDLFDRPERTGLVANDLAAVEAMVESLVAN
ncbi:MAG: threonine synthase [Acidimicrobiia bacterium]